jgi:hypothetical protein
MRDTINGYARKLEVEVPVGRPGHRCEDNIKMDLKKWGVEARAGFMRLRTALSGGMQ